MSDIAERMRHDPDNPDVRIWIARGREALAEIERLRANNAALLAELKFVVGYCCDQLSASTVTRIRAALTKAEGAQMSGRPDAPVDGCTCWECEKLRELARLQQAYANRGAEMDTMREVLAATQGWNEQATAKIERLVAALQEALSGWDHKTFNWDDWDERTRAAIAQAEGKS